MFKILALDQSSRVTGWALVTNKGIKHYGYFEADGDLDSISRLRVVKENINQLIEKYKPSFVVFEDTQYQSNANGFKILAMVQGVIMDILFSHNIDFYIVAPVTWKSFCGITGRKREEQKANTKAFVAKRYNIIATEDEADAIGIATWAIANIKEES